MDPATLLTIGPLLIRGIGKLFGGKTEQVAENVATMADQVKGLPADIAQQKLTQRMAELPVEDLRELEKIKNEAARIDAEREAARLQAQTAQHAETEQTRRAEIGSTDVYIRRTRPMMARMSAYITFTYLIAAGVLGPIINTLSESTLPGPDPWLVTAMFSPCLSYIGARGVESFSRWGKTADTAKALPAVADAAIDLMRGRR